MCQVAHFSTVELDDDHAEWTGDSRYVRPFHIEDLFFDYEDDEPVDFEMGPDDDDDDDSDEDIDMEDDDEDDE